MPDVEQIRVILPRQKIVKINVLPVGGVLVPLDVARLSLPNVFLDVNTFPGIRLKPKTITSDYTLLATDSEILVNAALNDVTISLHPAIATGQIYRIKRIDDPLSSLTQVRINADGTDTIDGDSSVPLESQYVTCTLVDSAVGFWDKGIFLSGSLPSNIAILDQNNVFTALNTFTGLRVATKTVISSDMFDALDFEILADCSVNDTEITYTLPPATGSGQIFRLKKIDDTDHVVTMQANGTDTIDGSMSVNLVDQWAEVEVLDASTGYWDNTRPLSDGGGGSADFGINGRVRDLDPIKGFAFDVFDGVDWIEQVRWTEPASGPSPISTVTIWYRPDILSLADLQAWPTVGNLAESRMDCLYNASSNVSDSYSSYVLRAGAAGADPGEVAPDDYDGGTNDVHWEQKA